MAQGGRRSFVIPDELYEETRRAAHRESLASGASVTLAEFIRRSIAERIERMEGENPPETA